MSDPVSSNMVVNPWNIYLFAPPQSLFSMYSWVSECTSWLPWGLTRVTAFHTAADTGLNAKVKCAAVWWPQWEEKSLVYKKKVKEGFTKANTFLLNSLPCSTTPPSLHLGNGPKMKNIQQIISNIVHVKDTSKNVHYAYADLIHKTYETKTLWS